MLDRDTSRQPLLAADEKDEKENSVVLDIEEKGDINVILQRLKSTHEGIEFLRNLGITLSSPLQFRRNCSFVATGAFTGSLVFFVSTLADSNNSNLTAKTTAGVLTFSSISWLIYEMKRAFIIAPKRIKHLSEEQQNKLYQFLSVAFAFNDFNSNRNRRLRQDFPLYEILEMLHDFQNALKTNPAYQEYLLNQQRISSFLMGKVSPGSFVSNSFFNQPNFESKLLGLIVGNLTGVEVVKDGNKPKRR